MTKHNGAQSICRRCLTRSFIPALAASHAKSCGSIQTVIVNTRIIMPPQDSKVYFKNHVNKVKRPAVVYAEFESLLLLFYCPHHDQTKTNINTRHLICSFCYIILYSDNTHSDPVQYRGPNAASTFLKAMLYCLFVCLFHCLTSN